jgi:hypothetical protein
MIQVFIILVHATHAEFIIDEANSIDHYAIFTGAGYDLPVQISTSNGGPTFTCNDPFVLSITIT